MKKFFTKFVVCLLVASIAMFATERVEAKSNQQAKYVFYFIADGISVNHIRGTEMYNAAVYGRDSVLSFSRFTVRTLVTSHSATSAVTDSAAAATALATGVKTRNGSLGVDVSERPVTNIAEVASRRGYKVGIATNVGINHATPSAFYAHSPSRSDYTTITDQLIASDVDFAAGSTIICRKSSGLKPADMVKKAEAAGIEVVQSAERAGKVKGRRVILLSDSLSRREMRFATDRGKGEPTIVDYTEAAIKYLERESKNDGFFLMVEAGHVDYASHDNDAVTVFEEINDLSRSVALALEFYERHPDETLIVVTADHETGGMAIGYSNYKMNMERLAYQRTSEEALTHKMQYMRKSGKTEWEDMKALLSEYLGLWDKVKLREKDERNLRKTFERNFLKDGEKVVGLYTSNEKMAAEAVRILNKRAYVNWIGLSHTAMQVPLYVKGAGELLFLDCYDNTDVPKRMAAAMGCELK